MTGVAWGVHPNLVGQGVGSRLVPEAVRVGREMFPNRAIMAVIRQSNATSRRRAEENGFVKVGEPKDKAVFELLPATCCPSRLHPCYQS